MWLVYREAGRLCAQILAHILQPRWEVIARRESPISDGKARHWGYLLGARRSLDVLRCKVMLSSSERHVLSFNAPPSSHRKREGGVSPGGRCFRDTAGYKWQCDVEELISALVEHLGTLGGC